ncbi:M1 family metallopeptidase [Demequina pelophila]|uniref:M1 family metallopeptidase n=1 Tax=Demequina pelophila TaxID=1638984 RepID=UPI000780CFE6|nr:M1 family metallopeptidase [Demequina pelophila]
MKDRYVPRRTDAAIHVRHYDLQIDYRVGRNRLDATAKLDIKATSRLDRIDLSFEGLRVSKVTVDGRKPAKWIQKAGSLSVKLPASLAKGDTCRLVVEYAGAPGPRKGTWGEIGWEELDDGVIVAGQPDGAPSWFPCHDVPEDKSTYRIAVTVDSTHTAVSNGVLVERSVRRGRVTWVYEQHEPMSTYLATVQIGRYEPLVLAENPVPIRAWAPVRLRRRVLHDLDRQIAMMELFRKLFGPYPFAEYSVVVTDDDLEIPLEAQGLSVFGANHMDGKHGSERLVAHELAHQWFGNSLTVGRWKDIWLHEGFACYAEWIWAEAAGKATVDDHAAATHRRLSKLPQDLVIGDPGPKLMFDDRLYKRGALTLHALRVALGDDAFFGAIRAWVVANRYGVVSRESFVECVEFETGQAIGGLLSKWLDRAKLPALDPETRR